MTSFGFGGMEEGVSGSAKSVVRGGRLQYEWCSGPCEWYVNGTQGLEHGFTFKERPVGSGPLRVRLAVRGNLQGQELPGGNGIGFADASGEVVLTYTGLRVFDALGVDQAASLTVANGQVQITVDEASAVYPLTIDPIAQEVYLKASNTDAGDNFGRSVAVSGNTVVVGAPCEDSAARGINGNQADNSNQDSGAAYVFVKAGGVWSQQAYLKASNGDSNDRFASALALEGDTLVVGARGESSASPGVNGDQGNNNSNSSGAAYVFRRNGSIWVQEAYLKASNADLGDQFGYAVAVGDGSIAVGAFSEDSKSSGVNGGQADNSVASSGAAYVFVKNGATWVQQAYVKPSNPLRGAVFGIAISISQDVLIVGAYGESSDGIGVNGSQVGVGATDCGAAYIFERTAGVWAQTTYMKPN
ncbi:MAG: FG-GAP repeat protein, partial [Planctomycetota bacterium]|nr:FG-GAP repeat protein [Planctomycetota bacterium]